MYHTFYLDKSCFYPENLDKIKNYLKFFSNKWIKDCLVININQSEFLKIYKELKELKNKDNEDIVEQSILTNLYKIIKFFRGTNYFSFDKIIQNYTDYENLIKKKDSIDEPIKFELAVLNQIAIEDLIEEKIDTKYIVNHEELFEKFSSEYSLPFRCISNFDRYDQFQNSTKKLKAGYEIKLIFTNYIFPLICCSKKIDIFDPYCLIDLLQYDNETITGLEYFFSFLKLSNIKQINLISGLKSRRSNIKSDQTRNQEEYEDGKAITTEMIIKKFQEKIIDKIYNRKKADKDLEVNLKILSGNDLDDLDRWMIFDDNSAIDIHGISSLSSRNGKLKKSHNIHRLTNLKEQQAALSIIEKRKSIYAKKFTI